MKGDEKRHLSSNLSELIEKFSQNDVIAEMEKEYQSAPAKLVPVASIDDNHFISKVKIAKPIVDYFASTLREKGIFNPLVVTPNGERFEIVLGRKRFLGAKKAGLVSLPCVIKEMGEEEELLTLLADNRDQRESNVLEMALICSALQKKFGYTQQTLASLSHQSRCQITNTMRLLRLSPELQEEVSLGKLSYGHAKAIASLNQEEMGEAVKKIHESKLSVRETERYVSSKKKGLEGQTLMDDYDIPNLKSLEIAGNSIKLKFASEEAKNEFLRSFCKNKNRQD